MDNYKIKIEVEIEAIDKTLGSLPESLAASGLADIALYEGRLRDAVEILEKAIVFLFP